MGTAILASWLTGDCMINLCDVIDKKEDDGEMMEETIARQRTVFFVLSNNRWRYKFRGRTRDSQLFCHNWSVINSHKPFLLFN